MTPAPQKTAIDLHVHLLGNGSSGSGCWMRLKGYHRFLAQVIIRGLGLPSDALTRDLDTLYINKLSELARNSDLKSAVLLAHEHVRDSRGEVIEGFGSCYVSNDYLLSVTKKYPIFLPGVSIHPARPDAFDELEKCLEGGAALMKCLPNCQNIDCGDKRFTRFWERMAEAKLPLLVHTGGELSVPVYDKRFTDPRLLALPLECGVTVIAAHCGTNSLIFDRNYLPHFREMLSKYPNLYGDNSGMQTPIRARHFKTILGPEFSGRVLHGSDFPIPVSSRWAKIRGLISKEAHLRLQSIKNPLQLDLEIKRAMGFPNESFTKVRSILRMPQK